MCLLIVEILMLVTGFWALVSGKLPQSLFKILFGKGTYIAESRNARLFGLLLMSPIPLAYLVSSIVAALFWRARGLAPATIIEFIILVTVCIIAIIFARRMKQPVDDVL